MKKILLVEDDDILAFSIEYTLKNEGVDVTYAKNLKEAREKISNNNFNLLLLDVRLPDGSGYELCREIRKTSDIFIIFLTACDEEVNIVSGLDMGADDYITKPFRIRELISRIKAVLRRNSDEQKYEILESGDIKVYTLSGKVLKNDKEIILTAMEYRLLLTFIKYPNQILKRNSILDCLWDVGGEFVDDNTLSVYIRRLREKIEDNPSLPKYITTVRGLGYRWGIGIDCEFNI